MLQSFPAVTFFTYSTPTRSVPRSRSSISFSANQIVRVKIVVIIAAFVLLNYGQAHG